MPSPGGRSELVGEALSSGEFQDRNYLQFLCTNGEVFCVFLIPLREKPPLGETVRLWGSWKTMEERLLEKEKEFLCLDWEKLE